MKKISSSSRPSSSRSARAAPGLEAALTHALREGDLPGQDMAAAARSLCELARCRAPGQAALRVLGPESATPAGAARTVVEAVIEDMPFALDSLLNELTRQNLRILALAHPVLSIRRDERGCVLTWGEKAMGAPREFFLHVQIDGIPSAQRREELCRALNATLAHVRRAVHDWPRMRDRVRQMAGHSCSHPQQTEACAFLEWLDKDHFVFLGALDYRLETRRGHKRLVPVTGSGLGLLQGEVSLPLFEGAGGGAPAALLDMADRVEPVLVTKTSLRSPVHRPVFMDAIFVRDATGKATERLLVGLFSSLAYRTPAGAIPLLRGKISEALAHAAKTPGRHERHSLAHILDTYPRDELFALNTANLAQHALRILRAQERGRLTVSVRADPFGCHLTFLIHVPRERYDTRLRRRFQNVLEEMTGGQMEGFHTHLDDAGLARVLLQMRLPGGSGRRLPSREVIEKALAEQASSWHDRLRESLITQQGEALGMDGMATYAGAFDEIYRETVPAARAASDIAYLARVRTHGRLEINLSQPPGSGPAIALCLQLFHRQSAPLPLSAVLPTIENMGLRVQAQGGPWRVGLPGEAALWVQDFHTRTEQGGPVDLAAIKPLFEDALHQVLDGRMEDDGFNRLVLAARLTGREVTLLRALARAMRQMRAPYAPETVASTLVAWPALARLLVDLFLAGHDPRLGPQGDPVRAQACRKELEERLSSVLNLDEDTIIRRLANLIESCLRTNYFQTDETGAFRPCLALKFDSRSITDLPAPRPLVETFVYSPRLEAVHLRGGKVARGGIRWSDRREDFRTEILGLMKAQMVKNAVIVPVGSKGGFVVKRPPAQGGLAEEGVACYRLFMESLLDLTDTRRGGKIVPPRQTVRRDGDDPYLVVAADKGTASFSDIANEISVRRGFWLGDAFASGGSAGYDHKAMGITARGAFVAVRRHFRDMGHHIDREGMTCVGVGDMSGDVFGNGMLLVPSTRLLAAFDHRHIFLDPDPDPVASFAERQRLFALPRSSWADYDTKRISSGGGVFARTAKSINISPAVRARFGLSAERMTPAELIRALLTAPVDLLWFGGIGTFIKDTSESHTQAGDRANDGIRVDAQQVRAKVIGEGANLGLTQFARISFARAGGRINTDAIDNSAGVDTSDHEVNLKILFNAQMAKAKLTEAARNRLLARMTDEVAALVLHDNSLQTQALTVAESMAGSLLPVHARCMRLLERTGLLDRALEGLPDEEEIAQRQAHGEGLARPELAVLLAYAKIALYTKLLASDLPDDPGMEADLRGYFPPSMRQEWKPAIGRHQLRREIAATVVTNCLVNRLGPHAALMLAERTGRSEVDIARAYILARDTLEMRAIWQGIEELDDHIPAAAQTMMVQETMRGAQEMILCILDAMPGSIALTAQRRHLTTAIQALRALHAPQAALGPWIEAGAGASLAESLALLDALTRAPEVAQLAQSCGRPLAQVAQAHAEFGRLLDVPLLRQSARHLATPVGTRPAWEHEAAAAFERDISALHRHLVQNWLTRQPRKASGSGSASLAQILTHTPLWPKLEALLSELRANPAHSTLLALVIHTWREMMQGLEKV